MPLMTVSLSGKTSPGGQTRSPQPSSSTSSLPPSRPLPKPQTYSPSASSSLNPQRGTAGYSGSGFDWDSNVGRNMIGAVNRFVTDQLRTVSTQPAYDWWSTAQARGLANAAIQPELNTLNYQNALTQSGLAMTQQVGQAAVAYANAEYQNALASLANSERGRTDKRWLLDEQLKLQQRYYDRINAALGDQTNAANRQLPLISAARADNTALYNIDVGELTRKKGTLTDQTEAERVAMQGRAATGHGWQSKGYRMEKRHLGSQFDRGMADIEGNLEKARINRDATDRNLTEEERKVQDQLRQLVRDGAANEDKRVGDYLQYLYDINEMGRQAAEDKLRAKQAADSRNYTLAKIAAEQERARTDAQTSSVYNQTQRDALLQGAAGNAAQYLGAVQAQAEATGTGTQVRNFINWFYKDAARQRLSRQQADAFLVNYIQSGQPMVIPRAARPTNLGRM